MKFKEIIKKNFPLVANLYYLIKVVNINISKWIPRYNEDELITGHYPEFINDEKFISCYNSAVKEGLAISDKICWRAHIICWAAKRGLQLEGDFVECGVANGFLSKIAIDYVDFRKSDKSFYLMDTYEGFSEKYLTPTEKKKYRSFDMYKSSYERVRNTFKDYKNVKLIKGAIPDTLPQVKSKKIAYLHIDMNCVVPEIAAIEYFWDKLSGGATVILDDYGHAGYEEQKNAFNIFAKDKDTMILCLPTGQGLIIK